MAEWLALCGGRQQYFCAESACPRCATVGSLWALQLPPDLLLLLLYTIENTFRPMYHSLHVLFFYYYFFFISTQLYNQLIDLSNYLRQIRYAQKRKKKTGFGWHFI